MIPYSRQSIDNSDINGVRILKSNFLTESEVTKFENKICDYVGSNYAITTNSATSALHIACMAIGVKKNDIVWTSLIALSPLQIVQNIVEQMLILLI